MFASTNSAALSGSGAELRTIFQVDITAFDFWPRISIMLARPSGLSEAVP